MQVLELRAEILPPLSADPLMPSTVYRLLADYSDAALLVVQIAADDARVRERIEFFRTRLRHIQPALTGDDLKQMGIPPGPAYKDILARLRDARLDGILTTREQEIDFVRHAVDPQSMNREA
jgi:tRNA nucleotidyltransferase (CCA-adding enzyme)